MQLESSNRRVDVIGEGFGIAVRVRLPSLEDTGLVMKVLGDSTQRLVASPELLAEAPGPLTPQALSAPPSLDEGPAHRDHVRRLQGPDGVPAEVRHAPRLAALRGVGIVQLPTMMVWQDLQAGRLVDVLPQWSPRPGIVHAVFPSRRGLLPAVRALIDFLAREYEALAEIERAG